MFTEITGYVNNINSGKILKYTHNGLLHESPASSLGPPLSITLCQQVGNVNKYMGERFTY